MYILPKKYFFLVVGGKVVKKFPLFIFRNIFQHLHFYGKNLTKFSFFGKNFKYLQFWGVKSVEVCPFWVIIFPHSYFPPWNNIFQNNYQCISAFNFKPWYNFFRILIDLFDTAGLLTLQGWTTAFPWKYLFFPVSKLLGKTL